MLKTQRIHQQTMSTTGNLGEAQVLAPVVELAKLAARNSKQTAKQRQNKYPVVARKPLASVTEQQSVSTTDSNAKLVDKTLVRQLHESSAELVEDDDYVKRIRKQRHLTEESAGQSGQGDHKNGLGHDRGQPSSQDDQQVNRGDKLSQSDDLRERKSKSDEKLEQIQEQQVHLPLVWKNIILFVILHSCLPVGIYMIFTEWPWKTLLFSLFGIYASGLGVTGGAHRLWSHRSYKAKLPVEILLMCLQTMAGQNSIYTWSRDHRLHHKFSETNADPHNIKRGLLFAHMGWLCVRKHPDVKEKGKLIDMSDLEANKVVMFQHQHFWWLAIIFTVLVPTMIPVLLWGEKFWTAFTFAFMVRYVVTLHGTWLVNSAAHYNGIRPYDEAIEARESPWAIWNGLGEGFHNYHHTFPYDYATSEFGRYFNVTTTFIDFCAALNLVFDRRKVDQKMIISRRQRTGDLAKVETSSRKEQEAGGENSITH